MKVTGPMFSLDASGSFGGAIVASKWKGRAYMRELVKPANPRSGGQVGTRAMFKFLSQSWAAISSGDKATWEELADQIKASPFNAYMKNNQKRWRNFSTPSMQNPAEMSESGEDITSPSATGGVRQISLEATVANAIGNNWGVAIFRSTTASLTPMFSNCIQVVLAPSAAVVEVIDTPLDPGTYFYKFRAFDNLGDWGDVSAEVSATVT